MPRKKNNKPPAGPRPVRLRHTANAVNLEAAFKALTSPHGFTMRDEARNTAHHHTTWGKDAVLRKKPVAFVSAGMIEPLKELNPVDSDAMEPSADGPEQLIEQLLDPASLEEVAEASPPELLIPPEPSTSTSPIHMPRISPSPIYAEPDGGDAMEEESFFFDLKGDAKLRNPSLPPPIITSHHNSAEESDASDVILFKGRSGPVQNQLHKKREIALDEIHVEITRLSNSISAAANGHGKAEDLDTSSLPRAEIVNVDHLRGTTSEEEAAIIADYIANMAETSDDELQGHHRSFTKIDIGGDDGAMSDSQAKSSDSPEAGGEEDAELDTLAGRVEQPRDQTWNSTPDHGMDDETLARLLAKQEELGMRDDDLVMFSDMFDGADAAFSVPRKSKKSAKEPAALKKSKGLFPSASEVADAFDDLDLMDWNRPSLQKVTKGRHKKPTFDVSDSELEAGLQTAWQNDRERKKQRKLDREELRAQGLLGKRADPDDPRLKYVTGMSLEQIRVELRNFLLGTEQSLAFPPMDKHSRKVLHELANKFGVKSNSTGSGDQRRPVLYRTKRTIKYVDEQFEIAVSRVGRKYFPRMDVNGKGLPRAAGGRGGHSAVTYRDGDVVGASAPELGQENKGRAMLEKMGWSSGMALGSLDNKGILQPVSQVVKRTKAGLG